MILIKLGCSKHQLNEVFLGCWEKRETLMECC